MRRRAALLFVAVLSGCEPPVGVDCPAVARPMIIIQVQDASNGQPAAEGATGTITEGAFSAPLVPYGQDRLAPQVNDRPGTYTVTVQKAGFQTWTRTGVRVPDGECGPETVHLEAFLVPG